MMISYSRRYSTQSLTPPMLLLFLSSSTLLLFLLPSITAWTPRLSAHNSSGRFHARGGGGGMKSLRATTKNNNKNAEDDNNSKNNDNNNAAGKDDVVEKTAKKKNGKKKRGRKLFWDDEYVSRLESLFDMDAPSESLAAGEDDAYDAFPGQRKNVVVLGDWMEWEEGGAESRSCVGDSCGDDSEQCDIPEHYKQFQGAPKVDVMSFLRIRRAEPLQVQRDWD